MKTGITIIVTLILSATGSAATLPRIFADLPPIKHRVDARLVTVQTFVATTQPAKMMQIIIYPRPPYESTIKTTAVNKQ